LLDYGLVERIGIQGLIQCDVRLAQSAVGLLPLIFVLVKYQAISMSLIRGQTKLFDRILGWGW
jgi:hypothetical protein